MSQGIFGGGDGSPANPYVVEDAADLSAMRFYPSASYVLGNSINLGVYPYNVGSGWLPISNFTGSLDGAGKKIMNLFINRPLANNVGLFAYFTAVDGVTATVHDVCFENANVTGATGVGILAGTFNNAVNTAAQTAYFVDECKFTGVISGGSKVGSVFGTFAWSGSLVYNPKVLNNIEISTQINPTTVGTYYGGWIGYFDSHGGALVFNNVVSTSTFNNVVNGVAMTTLGQQPLFGGCVNGSKSNTYVNCFFDSTLWPSTDTTYGRDSATLTLRTGTDTLDSVADQVTSKAVWSFSEGVRPPKLAEFLQRGFLVRVNGGEYVVYDAPSASWKTVFKRTPTRNEAVAAAMSDLSVIPQTAWASLRATYATVDLLSVVETSAGTTYTVVGDAMTADAANSTVDRNVYRKTINFADCGDAIVSITKEVIR